MQLVRDPNPIKVKSNQIKFICSNISQINIGNSKSIHEQGNKAENSTNSDPKTVG